MNAKQITVAISFLLFSFSCSKSQKKSSNILNTRLSAAFRSGMSWFADLFVALMSVWPLLLVAATIFIIWKRPGNPKVVQQNA